MHDAHKKEIIKKYLKEIEKKHNIKIIFATETGTAAWGLNTRNETRCVKAVFVHSVKDYILEEYPTTIIRENTQHNIQITAYDAKEFLTLVSIKDPSKLRWFVSPITYINTDFDYIKEFCDTLNPYQQIEHNCLSTAERFNTYNNITTPKEILMRTYAILSAKWAHDFHETPPSEINKLKENAKLNKTETTLLDSIIVDVVVGLANEPIDNNGPLITWLNTTEDDLWHTLEINMPTSDITPETINDIFMKTIDTVWKGTPLYA